ncbi:hypothetical protein DSLASN_08640 [Desulfoluna limicola]|uniref:Uncharacterized protein n=1 Tax=Desulfoluna limicola TaxID=2810562 RepID=A0ABN6EY26_9BACT|nr:hypothetical protein DSLASN_08640 [Desulfoluna limicola]
MPSPFEVDFHRNNFGGQGLSIHEPGVVDLQWGGNLSYSVRYATVHECLDRHVKREGLKTSLTGGIDFQRLNPHQ